MNDLLIVSLFGLKEIYGKEPIFLIYNKGVSAAIATFESETAAQIFCINFHKLKIKEKYFLQPHISNFIRLRLNSKIHFYTTSNNTAHFGFAISSNRLSLLKTNSKSFDGKTITEYMQYNIERKQIKTGIENQNNIKKNEFKK